VEKSTSNAQAVTPPLAPIAAAAGTGSALFVINLCASIAPVRLDGNNIPGLENYRLYQVARNEDGRTRHRLRLGFFTSESHAESVLTVVRQQYPTAFTACLCEEDRRFARGFLPEPAGAVPRPVATAAKQTPPAAPAKPTPAAAKTLAPAAPEVIELTWEPEAPQPQAKAASSSPTAPAKPVVNPNDGLDDFSWEPPSLTPAADAAIAKTEATGVMKAKLSVEKNTSDTAKHPALKIAPKQPASKPPVAAKPAAPVAKPATAVAAKPAAKPDPASSMRVRALDLTFSEPPPAPAMTSRAAPAGPFHVGKGVEFKDVGISLESEPAKPAGPAANAKPAMPAKPAAPVKAKTEKANAPAKPIAAPKVPERAAAKSTPAPIAAAAKPAAPMLPPIRISGGSNVAPPELDSTQTIRALTSAEMEDAAQEKWFAVQLAVSDQPVNLDAMPRLDIFEAYRLYSVATAGSGKIVHSLRLGFFKEAVSAEAVMGYLNTFFGSPSVMRVSVAEHARFKDAPSTKKPAPAPVQEAKVVELNNARSGRPVIPTVTMEVAPGVDTAATGSFRPLDTGSFRTSASGKHKALKNAAKSAGSSKTARAHSRTGNTGKHKTLPPIEKKSLAEQLLDEAREVELSESGIRKLPKNDSLLSRMLGKLTK
ncbi:MAG TPA: hypothetical protein VH814_08045, partial [Steroidobacteraceae bacterium]